MTEEFTRNGNCAWRMVGFFTEKYRPHAEKLIDSIRKYLFPASIFSVECLGDWHKNTHYKARFINDCMQRFTEDIVYVDCDAVVMSYPDLFNDIDSDVACWRTPARYGSTLSNGTILLKNNAVVKRMVKIWMELCDQSQRDCFEQEKFERAVIRSGVSLIELPITYCQIFDYPVQSDKPVIVHYQASRKFRERR